MTRFKSLYLQELVEKRKKAEVIVSSSPATQCPDFVKHVSILVIEPP